MTARFMEKACESSHGFYHIYVEKRENKVQKNIKGQKEKKAVNKKAEEKEKVRKRDKGLLIIFEADTLNEAGKSQDIIT